jgi:hypothetical protein
MANNIFLNFKALVCLNYDLFRLKCNTTADYLQAGIEKKFKRDWLQFFLSSGLLKASGELHMKTGKFSVFQNFLGQEHSDHVEISVVMLVAEE